MIVPIDKEEVELPPTEALPSYDDVTRDAPSDHAVVRDRKRPFLPPPTRTVPKAGSSSSRQPKPQSPISSTSSSSTSWISRTIRGASSSSSYYPP